MPNIRLIFKLNEKAFFFISSPSCSILVPYGHNSHSSPLLPLEKKRQIRSRDKNLQFTEGKKQLYISFMLKSFSTANFHLECQTQLPSGLVTLL